MPSEGTFVLADVGGYTQFLTGVGIEHGKEITSHLFNSLLKCNRGRWKVANIEGDCIFFYRQGREPVGELLEHVRALYEDFCGRATDVAARSTCPCGACARTSDLKLKFVVHSGEFDTQRIGNREELIGPDVVIAHRLLKNNSALSEYALLTRAYLGSENPDSLPSREGVDEYESIGAVPYVCLDLEPMRREFEERRQFFVSEDSARLAVTKEIEAPIDIVWHALTDLDKQSRWQSTVEKFDFIQGQEGHIGEVYRCIHNDGSAMVHVTVGIDEANHRKTEKVFEKTWMGHLIKEMYITVQGEELAPNRTRAALYGTAQPAIPLVSHAFLPLMIVMMKRIVSKDMEGLKAYCESEAASGPPAEARRAE